MSLWHLPVPSQFECSFGINATSLTFFIGRPCSSQFKLCLRCFRPTCKLVYVLVLYTLISMLYFERSIVVVINNWRWLIHVSTLLGSYSTNPPLRRYMNDFSNSRPAPTEELMDYSSQPRLKSRLPNVATELSGGIQLFPVSYY